MAFPSRFDSNCAYDKCPVATFYSIHAHKQTNIRKGDPIVWNRSMKGVVYHEACYNLMKTNGETAVKDVAESDADETSRDITVANAEREDTVRHTVSGTTAVSVGSGLAVQPAKSSDPLDLGIAIAEAISRYSPPNTAVMDESRVIELVHEHAPKPKVTVVEVHNASTGEVKNMGLQHFMFPRLLKACSARLHDGMHLNIWLTGPAGSGKTTAASSAAKALGLKFYFTGSLDNPYGLLGFTDANGKTVRTPFREAYEFGGVFLFDEVDGCAPNAVLAFNAALANGHCAFPDGVVDRHVDFVCIAAANTWGLGATNDYVGRMKQDAAFNDRFVQLAWEIDEELERATCPNPSWVSKVQTIRTKVKALGIKVVVSPRASYFGASLLAAGLAMADVEAMTLRKAMTAEQWSSVGGK